MSKIWVIGLKGLGSHKWNQLIEFCDTEQEAKRKVDIMNDRKIPMTNIREAERHGLIYDYVWVGDSTEAVSYSQQNALHEDFTVIPPDKMFDKCGFPTY